MALFLVYKTVLVLLVSQAMALFLGYKTVLVLLG
jgi:hypothetical protein